MRPSINRQQGQHIVRREKKMQIYGPVSVHGAQPINAPHSARSSQPAQPAAGGGPIRDELSISDAGRAAETQQSAPTQPASDVGSDRVATIRAQIAAGTYETPDKLDLAVSRLLDQIG